MEVVPKPVFDILTRLVLLVLTVKELLSVVPIKCPDIVATVFPVTAHIELEAFDEAKFCQWFPF